LFDSYGRSIPINANMQDAGTAYLEAFYKHFELILELKILF
jgi:hypothetical protein